MNVREFLETQNEAMKNLFSKRNILAWNAQTSGDKEWTEKLIEAEAEWNEFVASPGLFHETEKHLTSENVDLLEKRQLQMFYSLFKEGQIPVEQLNEMSKMSSELNLTFNTFPAVVNGKKYTPNEIKAILVKSNDQTERKNAWEASKLVGEAVEKDLISLVKKRNEAAKLLGYENYHQMAFELQELDRDEIFSIFQKIVQQTNKTYCFLKAELDEKLALQFGVSVEELRPWHYSDPFFQSIPSESDGLLESALKDKDILHLTKETFASQGMEIADLFDKCDLYPREGKNPTAFCMNLDREGDIRVLCNLEPNSYWMKTALHEFGHAAYEKYIDSNLPFVLRQHSHILTTEAIAFLYEKKVMDVEWLENFLTLHLEDYLEGNIQKSLDLNQLVKARFIITFVLFERELYENPDQDLNSLWWNLVREIQLITPPEDRFKPDWAAKIHFTLAPVYYQNYLLGELTSVQLKQYIKEHVSDQFFTEEVGEFLKATYFMPGASLHWNEKIKQATGEFLNPQYFVKEYCREMQAK